MASDPLEFCDLCFQKGKPNLCETYKNTFIKIVSIHFSQQAKLDRLLNNLEVMPRMVERRWTCTVGQSSRREFLDSLWGIGLSVHTLEDHLNVLTRLYRPEIRPLGGNDKVELPREDLWEEFNPKTRNWEAVKVTKKDGTSSADASIGNILKCSGMEGASYYRVNKTGNAVSLISLEKRAALNIMSTLAEPSVVYWKSDNLGNCYFLDVKDLGVIPEEIFNFVKRIGKKDRKNSDLLVFENEDLDSVRAALNCIKINLVKSEETVDIQTAAKSGKPIGIAEIDKDRLQVLYDVINEMGGSTAANPDNITVSGKRGSLKITFTDEDKSSQEGSSMKVSVAALDAPYRFSEILNMIKKRLGLLDVSLENSLAQNWPVLNDSDLQYVVQSAISWYGANPVLAVKIISNKGKLGQIKDWNLKIKEGKIRSTLDTITLGKIIKRAETS